MGGKGVLVTWGLGEVETEGLEETGEDCDGVIEGLGDWEAGIGGEGVAPHNWQPARKMIARMRRIVDLFMI